MTDTSLKRTPLYDCHVRHEARFVSFAGWEMPVQYTGVVPEHRAVREQAGLFDVSHMGEVFVTGPQAREALDFMTCNNVAKLVDGQAQYNAIINEGGGVVDDIIIYRFSEERFLVCVNAANADKAFDWFQTHNSFEANFSNQSSEYGQIALQGPQAVAILNKLVDQIDVSTIGYFRFQEIELLGRSVVVARTGYTGEDGYELFVPCEIASDLWQALIETGSPLGLIPAGLGARDSLRLEACYPLHGHELGDEISAIESGLGWIVKLKKGDFIGRDVLASHRKEGAPRKLVGFYVTDRGIVREGDKIYSQNEQEIGVVTSGTKTPTLNRALGLALIKSGGGEVGDKLLAEVRGKKLECELVETPFYKRER